MRISFIPSPLLQPTIQHHSPVPTHPLPLTLGKRTEPQMPTPAGFHSVTFRLLWQGFFTHPQKSLTKPLPSPLAQAMGLSNTSSVRPLNP